MATGKIFVVGFGPGDEAHMTHRAKDAIVESDSVIGYKTYMDLVSHLIKDKEIVRTGMTEEVSRAREAVRQAESGKKVAVISSGDAGLYGMAGLVYEVLMEQEWREEDGIGVEIIPGVSAINSCASLLGAPVMHDACTISLSDHLTPWELIKKRVEAAAQADFVIALYNPKSGRRTRQIEETQRILLKYRDPKTPVGLVKSAYREREHIVMTDLARMLDYEIGMLTTVIIGNNSTFYYDGKMITPRGYQRKYTLGEDEQSLKPAQRLKPEAEPWAMHGGVDDRKKKTAPQPTRESTADLANEALSMVGDTSATAVQEAPAPSAFKQTSVFEFALSPGVWKKSVNASQLALLAEIIGDQGEVTYTPSHYLRVSLETEEPQEITRKLESEGWLVSPVGDVIHVKACDFCDGEKTGGIPYAEELKERLGGLKVPKVMKIGFNGCGMACYGAVADDIGIVYRRGAFDVFLGAKAMGRNAHTGQPVAEGLPPERLMDTIVSIVDEYREKGMPNERFYKFFKRVQRIQNFQYQEMFTPVEVNNPCE
ncbi:precorrin-3B C(17)-methyltransferase [Alteribacillus iranensis]|uniref:Cobalt-precorrin 3 C17-methyltransferase n=1 Tax=Alteribacillus iranensis TaxID=930128 RepID=A0A1I2B8R0_9BACI|nr:precorrin-3B C(17)-methyltransferase [Alteribacillus iranensis]SFE51540.1 cobalt-precorrin 3 C17-methyltransferase [Alteribacillus iranensis]